MLPVAMIGVSSHRDGAVLASGSGRYSAPGRVARRMGAELSVATGAVDRRLSPGGVGDISARLMGQWLSERLGQPFVIENRPGAASNIATEAVVKAPPDGYTLLHVSTTNAINATLYDKLNFRRDIAPVAGIIRVPLVMVVNPSVPAKTVTSLSPTPRPIRAGLVWHLRATGAPLT